jgi:hypothetical protein
VVSAEQSFPLIPGRNKVPLTVPGNRKLNQSIYSLQPYQAIDLFVVVI